MEAVLSVFNPASTGQRAGYRNCLHSILDTFISLNESIRTRW